MKYQIVITAGAAAVMTASVASAAWGASSMNYSQDFYIEYNVHGSTGPQDGLTLYDGDLHLYSVIVRWQAEIGSYFDQHIDDADDEYHYAQTYAGVAGFFVYGSGVDGYGSSAFSGATDCTQYLCSVFGSASGVTSLSPDQFVGSGTFSIDFSGYINPTWFEYPDSGVGSSLRGSITYVVGEAPEPASWAMMLAGFGAIGSAMRNHRRVAVSFR